MNQVRAIEFAEYGVTNVHSVAIGFMAAMTALTLAPKRSAATFAILSVCIFMPMDQRLVVGGIDLSMLRLILMVGAARVVIRREYVGFSYGRLDRLVLWWVVSTCVFYLLRVGPGSLVTSLGHSFDVLASYFLVRVLVRSPGDVSSVWKQLAWIVVVLSPFIFYESVTRHNVFGMFSYSLSPSGSC